MSKSRNAPTKSDLHFVAIQSVLDPHEAQLARDLAASLEPVALRAWLDELSHFGVAQAVLRIRALFAKGKLQGRRTS
jgi:hypothetical protein